MLLQDDPHLAVEDINEVNSELSLILIFLRPASDSLDRRVEQLRNPASAVEEPGACNGRHGREEGLLLYSEAGSWRLEKKLAATFGYELSGASCQGEEAGSATLRLEAPR